MYKLTKALMLISALTALAGLTGCPKKPAAPANTAYKPPASAQARNAATKASVPSSTSTNTHGQPSMSTPGQPSTSTPQQPRALVKNAAGLIPATQAYETYKSAAGMYAILAPKDWTRTESGTDVTYERMSDGLQVTITKAQTAPTIASVKSDQVAALQKNGREVQSGNISSSKLANGLTSIYVVYTSDSDPNPVTKQQVRLDNITYYYYMPGMLATVHVWNPAGVDNTAQWKRVFESFSWK